MKKLSKKVLTVLLALVLVVSVATVAALASGATPATTAEDLAKAIAPSGDDYDHNKVDVNGNKVTLKGNIESGTVKGDIAINGGTGANELTLDLGSYTLTLGDSNDGRGGTWNNEIVLLKGAKLKITGTSGTVTTKGSYATIAVYGGSSLTVEKGVTIKNEHTAPKEPGENAEGAAIAAAISNNNPGGGKIAINGATVIGLRGISVDAEGSTLTVGKDSNITGTTYNGIMAQGNADVTVNGGTIKGGPTGVYVGGYDPKSKTTSPGHLTVNGGTIEGTGEDSVGVFAYHDSTANISNGEVKGHTGVRAWDGAAVEINGSAKIDGTESGVDVYGFPEENAGNNGAAKVTISGGTVNGRYGAFAYGGGQLTVSGGTVTGQTAGIGTNGSDVSEETQVTVTGGKVTGTTAGVYLPAGKMNVSDKADISGKAGIVVRGGDLSVSGGTITATDTGNVTIGDATQGGKRYQVPAAAITVDVGADYPAQTGGQKHVTVSGDATVKAPEGGKSIVASNGENAVTPGDGNKVAPENNPFDIKGGKLEVGDKLDEENVTTYLPKGYEYEDEKVTEVANTNFVAEIVGGMKYTSLQDAIDASANGNVIKLLDNVEIDTTIKISNKITLDLDTHKITKKLTSDTDGTNPAIKVSGTGAELTIKGTGSIEGTSRLVSVEGKGAVILEGGTLSSKDKENTASTNVAAVKVNDGTLTVKGGKISAEDSAIYAAASGTVTISGGEISSTKEIAVGSNGSESGAVITVNGGTITSDTSAGIYLPSGTLTVSKGTVKGAAGIVVRGGTATVKGDADVEATGEENFAVGDDTHTVAPAAVVVDIETGYSATADVTLSDGTFTATKGDAVVYSKAGKEDSAHMTAGTVTVTGGFYSKSVNSKFLASNLNTELKDKYNRFSYYSSEMEAEEAMVTLGGSIIKNEELDKRAKILAVGFLPKKNDTYLNGLAGLVKDGATKWNPEITDSGANTFYAVFKADDADVTSGATYTVVFTCGNRTYSDKVTVNAGGIVYFEPTMATPSTAENFQGKYTVALYAGGTASGAAISEATLNVYRVNYEAVTGVTGEAYHTYCEESELETAEKYVPDTFKLNSGVNKWNVGVTTDKVEHVVTVTIGGEYSAPIDPEHKCPTKGFKDMELLDTSKLWYHEAMDYMVLNGYIKGFDGVNGVKNLQPNGIATRAQMLVIMAQVRGTMIEGKDPWYKPAVEWAQKYNYSDGLRPNDPIQREEIVTILWRMADEPKGDAKYIEDYPDVASVNSWAKTAMAWAVEKGIMGGRVDEKTGKDVLVPQGIGTRAELAMLIYNYVTLMK